MLLRKLRLQHVRVGSLACSLALLSNVDEMVGLQKRPFRYGHLAGTITYAVVQSGNCLDQAAAGNLQLRLGSQRIGVCQADRTHLGEADRFVSDTLAGVLANGIIRYKDWRRCIGHLADAASGYTVRLRINCLIVIRDRWQQRRLCVLAL